MKQLDQQAVKEHNEKITGSKWLGCDGRVDTVPQLKGKSIKEDHITIIDGITGDYKDHITPEPIVGLNENGSDSHGAGSAPALALALYDFLEVTNGVDTVEGFNLDGCPTNVGGGDSQEGAIYFLEMQEEHPTGIPVYSPILAAAVPRALHQYATGLQTLIATIALQTIKMF